MTSLKKLLCVKHIEWFLTCLRSDHASLLINSNMSCMGLTGVNTIFFPIVNERIRVRVTTTGHV